MPGDPPDVMTDSNEGASGYANAAIEKTTDELRKHIDEAERDSEGKKREALQKAREHLDDFEQSLKKRT